MKDRSEPHIPKPSDFVTSQKFGRAQKGETGDALAERKGEPGATHAHTSREAAGMIPGESLRSFLGEGASETERERPRWLPSACSGASLIIKGVCFKSWLKPLLRTLTVESLQPPSTQGSWRTKGRVVCFFPIKKQLSVLQSLKNAGFMASSHSAFLFREVKESE